ncbi:MAG TPA: dephospho-CoA kinase [Candidatus Polarisedimenticolia bacterium]|nr:dephospho-CoA kinase [Candidatus Polarisedimenticolia bacterium]
MNTGTGAQGAGLRVGLTGGIATGKSVVAEVFREAGAFVQDADSVGHELMEPGTPAHAEIVQAFGEEVVAPDGRIDRKRLGARIFADAGERSKLNTILHPRILAEAGRRAGRYLLEHPGGIAVTQAALLLEAGAAQYFDRIVLTECDARTQRARLVARDGIPETEADRRIAAQGAASEKKTFAHLVIDTSGTIEQTRKRAQQAFETLRRDKERA